MAVLALTVTVAGRAAHAQSVVGGAAGQDSTTSVAAVPSSPRPASARAVDTLTLTLQDVQRRTLAQNPVFLAARQDTAIARGGLRQARVYQFNPDLTLQPGAASGGSRNPTEITLLQEVEVGGQRGLRIGAARFGVDRATATVANAARLTLSEASVAFYRVLAADRRLAVAREVMALNERLLEAVRVQRSEGELSTLDANLAEIELGRARGRVLATRRAAISATLELKRVTGLAPDVEVRLVDPSAPSGVLATAGQPVAVAAPAAGMGAIDGTPAVALDRDSLVALALARRPDLASGTAAIRELETLRSLARRQNVPNLRLGAFIERQPGTGSGRLGPAVGLSLPLFNRNQGLAAQRAAQAEQARITRQATELRIRTEVTDAVRAYQTASDEAAVFATSVLQPARQNSTLLEAAYRAGKIGLATVLLLRNQLLEAELGYWDAWLAQREARVQLQAATGALTASATDSSR